MKYYSISVCNPLTQSPIGYAISQNWKKYLLLIKSGSQCKI